MAWKNHALRDAWLVVRCALAAPEEDRKDQIKGKHHEIKDKAKRKLDRSRTTPTWRPRAKLKKIDGVVQKKSARSKRSWR